MKKLKKAAKKTRARTRDSAIPETPVPVRDTNAGHTFEEESAALGQILCTAVWGAAAVWHSGVPVIAPGRRRQDPIGDS